MKKINKLIKRFWALLVGCHRRPPNPFLWDNAGDEMINIDENDNIVITEIWKTGEKPLWYRYKGGRPKMLGIYKNGVFWGFIPFSYPASGIITEYEFYCILRDFLKEEK